MAASIVSNLVHHPRRLWLRRASFQIHLWMGVLLSLYLILIALSGSVLVFKDELTRWSLPPSLSLTQSPAQSPTQSPAQFPVQSTGLQPFAAAPSQAAPSRMSSSQVAETTTPEAIMARFAQAVPGGTVTLLQLPSPVLPAFLLEGRDAAGQPCRWLGDPVSGALQPARRNWLDVVHDFHYYLLLPPRWGMQANAAGAAVLLVLTVTGAFLWWPGVRNWLRGLRVNLRANWRRINYDLHSAIGIWTLLLVFWWAFSGVYFGWYRPVAAAVAYVSPLHGMLSPPPLRLPPARPGARASLAAVLQAAQAASPRGRLWSISDPSQKTPDSFVLLDLRAPGDFSHRDIVRVRNADAQVLSVWHYGERHSLGDTVLWLMHPLHFGTLWGLAGKIVWALLGISLAVLTVTGLLMYWNRYLRRIF